MPEISEVAVIVGAATTDHEHDHGGFPNPRPGHGSLPSFRSQL